MEQQLQTIREKALAQLAEAQDTAALEQLRVSVLGKKGELTSILRGMGKLPAEERPKMGQMVNETRAAIEEALAEKLIDIFQSGGLDEDEEYEIGEAPEEE